MESHPQKRDFFFDLLRDRSNKLKQCLREATTGVKAVQKHEKSPNKSEVALSVYTCMCVSVCVWVRLQASRVVGAKTFSLNYSCVLSHTSLTPAVVVVVVVVVVASAKHH